MKSIDRLSLGRYEGSISYPDGCRLEQLEVLVDPDGNLQVRWLQLPGKPSQINGEEAMVGTYMVAFSDGTTMQLRAC